MSRALTWVVAALGLCKTTVWMAISLLDAHLFAVEDESVRFKSSCGILGESPGNNSLCFNS